MKRSHLNLSLLAALLLVLVALLAGGSLGVLMRMHGQIAHTRAAATVLEQGRLIAAHLARQPAVTEPSEDSEADWNRFSGVVRSLHTLENGLQYVSVARDGVVHRAFRLARMRFFLVVVVGRMSK